MSALNPECTKILSLAVIVPLPLTRLLLSYVKALGELPGEANVLIIVPVDPECRYMRSSPAPIDTNPTLRLRLEELDLLLLEKDVEDDEEEEDENEHEEDEDEDKDDDEEENEDEE
jgi:hypothetical protein